MTIDTLKIAKRLQDAGIAQGPAEALAQTFQEAQGAQLDQLATKPELMSVKAELKSEMAGVRQDLKSEVAALRQEIAAQGATLREEIKRSAAETKNDLLKWAAPLLVGQAALTAALVRLFGTG